jgi:TldD protein
MMPSTTRREFLRTASLAAAGAGTGLWGQQLSALALRSSAPAAAYLPDPTPDDTLRTLATSAIDAARAAGARYADIRVASRRSLRMRRYNAIPVPISEVTLDHAYGIRSFADGAWAFAYGTTPTTDAVTASARHAAADARLFASVSTPADMWAPVPLVRNGEWWSPAEIDPLSVPMQEQVNLLGAFTNAAMRIPAITDAAHTFDWVVETRVFASTDGTMMTQHFTRAFPRSILTRSVRYFASVSLEPSDFCPVSAGYETVLRPGLQDHIKATAEEVGRLVRLPERQLDVGRYDVIFEGQALGALFGETINPALEMDRVLGHDLDTSGSSFLTPPADTLGAQLFSPVLSVRARQSPQNLSHAKWDDDGVATEEFPLITNGRVVDYFTTRSTASVPRRSRGCAIAWSPLRPPAGYAGHLALAPGAQTGRGVEALYKQMKRGVVVRRVWGISADQSLLGANITRGTLFEVRDGQIVGRIRGNSLYVRTLSSWKAVTELGDTSTLSTYTRKAVYGQPWWAITQNISAPAALMPGVTVMHVPRNT